MAVWVMGRDYIRDVFGNKDLRCSSEIELKGPPGRAHERLLTVISLAIPVNLPNACQGAPGRRSMPKLTMQNSILSLLLPLSLLAAAPAVHAQATAADRPVDRIVAVVDDDVILRANSTRRVERQATVHGPCSPAAAADVLDKQVLERLVLRACGARAASPDRQRC